MSRKRIEMRKTKEILRLRFSCGCSLKEIAKSIGIGKTTVADCLDRAKRANLIWPLPEDLTDDQLESKLYKIPHVVTENKKQQGEIDWAYINKELKRKSVTLALLWKEYKSENPRGLSYSQFCRRYRDWGQHLDVWMRQTHKLGEKLFVDYAGQTMPVVINKETGEIREAQIFVATLGASNFTYAEATWTQTLPDWIGSHVRAFDFFEGCAELLIPDNLLSGVHKSHLYEPELNPTYQDMAAHYGVAIMPARVRTPKDKSKVENGVQQVERRILASLRNRTFFSLGELNQAVKIFLKELNNCPFQKIPGSRLSHFQELEKPALKPLPTKRYEFAQWRKVKAGFNYHINIEGHHYSIPFLLVKRELYVRYTAKTIEVFHQEKRVASHARSYIAHGYTTETSHMPKKHQKHAEWTPERIASWARKTGPSTEKLVEAIMNSRAHPQQGFRSCVGILRLVDKYGDARVEAACARALAIGGHSFKSVESILKKNLEQKPLPFNSNMFTEGIIPENHENIRGQNYFN